MTPIERSEIFDYVTYTEQRDEYRAEVLKIKNQRRIHVGENLTFLFENRETIKYQIQEMLRIEKIVKETDIQHEIDTYNELLGKNGELGCTLLIEYDDVNERDVKLRELSGLLDHVYLITEEGSKVSPIYDKRQIGDEKISSVHYLIFEIGSGNPSGIIVDHPSYISELEFSDAQAKALKSDLKN